MQTNVNRKFITNNVITLAIALITGFSDCKISYYTLTQQLSEIEIIG